MKRQYNNGKRPEDTEQKYWEVSVEEENWHKPWNYELEKELDSDEKKKKRTILGRTGTYY